MNFVGAIKSCFNKYTTFSGRAPRSEYWYWFLFKCVVDIIAYLGDHYLLEGIGLKPLGPLTLAAMLVFYAPSLSVAVRRMHDTSRSGWKIVIPFCMVVLYGAYGWATTVFELIAPNPTIHGILVLAAFVSIVVMNIWMCLRGANGNNRYGPDPLA